jgi:hypothetical protein
MARAATLRKTELRINEGSYSESSLPINELTRSFIGEEEETTIITSSATSGSLFPITTGSLSLSLLTLIRDSSASVSCPLFTMNGGGTLSLTTCTISPETAQASDFSEPFFCLSGGTTTLNGVSMTVVYLQGDPFISGSCPLSVISCGSTRIKRKSGNGGVFEGTLEESTTLTINDCTFTSQTTH